MSFASLLAIFARSILVQRIATYAAGLVIGLGALGVIVEKAGPGSQAVVHVIESDVEVAIGDQAIRVEARRFEPLVFDLEPGRHEVVMSRGDRVLYRESFVVKSGSSWVLNAMAAEPESGAPGSPLASAMYPPSRFPESSEKWPPGHEAGPGPVISTADR